MKEGAKGGDDGVGDAAAEAFIRSRTTGVGDAFDHPGDASPNDDDAEGEGDGDGDEKSAPRDDDGDGDDDDTADGDTDENEFDGFGGEWARFDLALARLAKVTRALKVRRLTFQPVLERTRGNLHPCALWATVTGVREPPSLRYYVGGGPRTTRAEKKSGKTLELRELIEVTRGEHHRICCRTRPSAARRSASRCGSSKTVNLVFGTKKERERFAKALGLAAAHVKSLIGCTGVNVAARRHAAVAVMGLNRKDLDAGPDALPTQLCAASTSSTSLWPGRVHGLRAAMRRTVLRAPGGRGSRRRGDQTVAIRALVHRPTRGGGGETGEGAGGGFGTAQGVPGRRSARGAAGRERRQSHRVHLGAS